MSGVKRNITHSQRERSKNSLFGFKEETKRKHKNHNKQNHTFSNHKLRFERRTVKHLVDSECDKGYTSYANLIEYGLSLFAAARVKQQRVGVRSLYREATHIACSSWIHRKEI